MRINGRRCLPGRRARGFTLIELIIALALIALITLLLFSACAWGPGPGTGWMPWRSVTPSCAVPAPSRSGPAAVADLTLRLEDQDHQVFAGNGESLEFAAPLSEYVGVPGLYILRLGLDGRGKNRRLVLTRWLLHPDVLQGEGGTGMEAPGPGIARISGAPAEDKDLAAGAFGQTVLLEGVEDFELAYFGVAEEIDGLTPAAGAELSLASPRRPRTRTASLASATSPRGNGTTSGSANPIPRSWSACA